MLRVQTVRMFGIIIILRHHQRTFYSHDELTRTAFKATIAGIFFLLYMHSVEYLGYVFVLDGGLLVRCSP